ncbi:MAG TPA: ABC transporter substrate-binding protein [Rhodocyclaceae bacterium]
MIRFISALLFAALFAASPLHAQTSSPEDLVKSTSEDVLNAIRQTHDRQKLQQLAEQKVVPHFDFSRMTQLAVGRAWRQATPDQQQQLQDQFRELLVRTYTNAMAAGTHGNAKIRMKPSHGAPQGGETVVHTEAVEPGRAPIAIDYYMEQKPDGWKVYDVAVDSVSLVTNYRGQFESTVSQSGVDGLIRSLAQKNQGQAGKTS